jgi:hypothetical protein
VQLFIPVVSIVHQRINDTGFRLSRDIVRS